MPPVAAASLLQELLDNNTASALSHVHRGSRIPSSFAVQACEEGFKCVSSVDKFGLNHDGIYKGVPLNSNLPAEYKGAYEWGCPVRGTLSPSGECTLGENGNGDATKLCWSTARFEAGKNSPCKNIDDCMCVKPTESGNTMSNNKYAEIDHGKEVQTQKYLVAPVAQCDKCSDHDCSPTKCNKCEECEYTTKTFGSRTTEGCFEKDKSVTKTGAVKKETGRPYLDNEKATETDLIVIPHYKMYDPGATRSPTEEGFDPASPSRILRMSYQNRHEPLSAKAWVEKYTEAAPRIQRQLDATRANIIHAGSNASSLDCYNDDFSGRGRRFLSLRRGCMEMQQLANKLAPDTHFPDRVLDGNGVMQSGSGCVLDDKAHDCKQLNCYADASTNKDLVAAFDNLDARGVACKTERAAAEAKKAAQNATAATAKGKAAPAATPAAASAGGSQKAAELGAAPATSSMPLPAAFLAPLPHSPAVPAADRRERRHDALINFL